jgi:hypothetical protein
MSGLKGCMFAGVGGMVIRTFSDLTGFSPLGVQATLQHFVDEYCFPKNHFHVLTSIDLSSLILELLTKRTSATPKELKSDSRTSSVGAISKGSEEDSETPDDGNEDGWDDNSGDEESEDEGVGDEGIGAELSHAVNTE